MWDSHSNSNRVCFFIYRTDLLLRRVFISLVGANGTLACLGSNLGFKRWLKEYFHWGLIFMTTETQVWTNSPRRQILSRGHYGVTNCPLLGQGVRFTDTCWGHLCTESSGEHCRHTQEVQPEGQFLCKMLSTFCEFWTVRKKNNKAAVGAHVLAGADPRTQVEMGQWQEERTNELARWAVGFVGAFAPEPPLLFLELSTPNGAGPGCRHGYTNLPPRSQWSHVSMWLFLNFLEVFTQMSLPQKAFSAILPKPRLSPLNTGCSSLAIFWWWGGGGGESQVIKTMDKTLI